MDNIIKLRDLFKESAEILDELIDLKDKEETPEIVKQCESLLGIFVMKMIELNSLDIGQ